MNTPIDLITRAAARLRDLSGPDLAPVSPQAASAAARGPASASQAPTVTLSRIVPLSGPNLAQKGILMPWVTTARVVEEYRIVKRKVMSTWLSPEAGASPGDRPRVVMITSARPREGKTFSSINLALAFAAERNLTTILIDADTVQGDTAKTLQLPSEPGLIDVLGGGCSLMDALIQTDLPNLVVLPSGAPGPHVPELLSGKAPIALFAQIAEYYPNHVIILDTPPCLASTDAAALAPMVDQCVFVVRAGHTQRPEVESAVGLISSCPQVSLLLNLVPIGLSENFGSYGSYGYYQHPVNL